MAEKEKAGPSLDFKTVLLVAAVVGGAALVHTGLQSSRPDEKQTLERTALGDQVVPARLWQDPFEVTLNYRAKHRERIQSEEASTGPSRTNRAFHSLREMAHQLTRHQEINQPVTVLEVMTSGGSYAEDAEERQRHRYAVLSALGTAGYIPADSEHLGYAQTRWPRGEELEGSPVDKIPTLRSLETNLDSRLVVPFEWYIRNPLRADSKATSDILVMWLNADAFEDHPLKRLAQLNNHLLEEECSLYSNSIAARRIDVAQIRELTKFKLLEPRVHAMLEEIPGLTNASSSVVRAKQINLITLSQTLTNLELYSSWATTPDAVLGKGGRSTLTSLPACESWRFIKATSTDDELAEELIDELGLRKVDLTDTNQCVALISESDTFYGRALPLAFAATLWCRIHDRFTTNSLMNTPSAFVALREGSPDPYGIMWSNLSPFTRGLLHDRNSSRSDLTKALMGDFNRLLNLDLRSLGLLATNIQALESLRKAYERSPIPEGKRRHFNRLALEALFPTGIRSNDFATAVAELEKSPAAWPSNILVCTYLRGIDGKLPGDTSEESPSEKAKSKPEPDPGTASQGDGALQRPEGHSQMDYLPRVADRLLDLERRFKRDNRGELKAVGILGSDVYDKLLVLQSLRGKFTDELFFTTDLDARLFHPDSLKYTRNLLVASSFGLRLRDGLQREIPPFRDTYQTGQYLACLAALDSSGAVSALGALVPRRFELGWNGAYDLSLQDAPVHPNIPRPFQWTPAVLKTVRLWVIVGVVMTFLAAALSGKIQRLLNIFWVAFRGPQRLTRSGKLWLSSSLFLLLIVACCNPLLHDLGFLLENRTWNSLWSHRSVLAFLLPAGLGLALVATPSSRLQALIARQKREIVASHRDPPKPFEHLGWWPFRGVILLAVILVAGLALFIFLDDRNPQGEPFLLTAGLSVWPTEIIRFLAGALAIYFLFQSHSELQENRKAIRKEFNIGEPPWTPRLFSQWRRWRTMLGHLFPPGETETQRSVKAGLIKTKLDLLYLFGQFSEGDSRGLRVASATLLYAALMWAVYTIFDKPFQPARGHLSRSWDQGLDLFSGTVLVALVFFAADASRVCRKFIESLTGVESLMAWPENLRDGLWPGKFHDEYWDFRAIALRSEAVNRLIFYPFFVLFLLIIARNDFFDRWDWPPSTLLFFTLCSGYAVYAVLTLRFAAEKARKSLLKRLDESLLSALARPDDGLVQQLGRLREKIEQSEEGAFAPLSQQPVIKALLMCFSGAGALPVLNYLASKF
jgi:hypothetical protein